MRTRKEDQEQNVDDGLNQSQQAGVVGGEEPQQNEMNDSLDEQGEREVEENNPKEEIPMEQVPNPKVFPQIQDMKKEDQEHNDDDGLNQPRTVTVGEPQLKETND